MKKNESKVNTILSKIGLRRGNDNGKPKKEKTTFTRRTTVFLFVCCWLLALSPVLVVTYLFMSQPEDELPSIERLENPPELLASVVFADDGKTELGRYWSVNRTSVDYKDISPYVFDALIATEDERFIEHSGIDFRALGRAVSNMGEAGGASTISQQLAKLMFTLEERERIAQLKAEGKPIPEGPSGLRKRLNEKIKENIIAVRLEKRYTKMEIITMYLNQFDFLYNAVGIENAAKVYFNKKPADLTKNEAAMLVGMCKNPSLYNPYTYQVKDYRSSLATRKGIAPEQVSQADIKQQRSADSLRCHTRRDQVLKQWLKNSKSKNPALNGFVTQAEYDSLKSQSIVIDYQVVDHKQGIAPYFRETLRSELKGLFAEKNEDGSYKYAKKDGKPYNLYTDGLKIYTTINVSMQEYAEESMRKHLRETLQNELNTNLKNRKDWPFANWAWNMNMSKEDYEATKKAILKRAQKQSERYYNLKQTGKSEEEILKTFEQPVPLRLFSWDGPIDTIMTPNDSIRYAKSILRSGMMSMDPNTGFVKAWVGGIDFNHFAFDHVKQGKRQVGSTIKPFVYGTAISMQAVKPCTKFEAGTSYCVDVYGPNGEVTKQWCPAGDVPAKPTVALGLATSNNPITVAVMSKMGGYAGPKTISKILSSMEINLRPEDEVPSMCLGVMDLSVYQMVAAQSMWVNQGIYTRPTTILRIEDRNGNVIYSADPYSKEVMNANVAYTTLQMMKGVVQFGTGGSLRWHQKWGGISHPMAGKTGTTQSNSDGWFIGLTPDLVTGVWVGGEDRIVRFNRTDLGQGAHMALPIYGYYMQKVYKDKKLKISTDDFEEPIGYDPEQFSCEGENDTNGDPFGLGNF